MLVAYCHSGAIYYIHVFGHKLFCYSLCVSVTLIQHQTHTSVLSRQRRERPALAVISPNY